MDVRHRLPRQYENMNVKTQNACMVKMLAQNCVFLGYYAASIGNFLQRNNPEKRNSELLRRESLKSRMLAQYKLPCGKTLKY